MRRFIHLCVCHNVGLRDGNYISDIHGPLRIDPGLFGDAKDVFRSYIALFNCYLINTVISSPTMMNQCIDYLVDMQINAKRANMLMVSILFYSNVMVSILTLLFNSFKELQAWL